VEVKKTIIIEDIDVMLDVEDMDDIVLLGLDIDIVLVGLARVEDIFKTQCVEGSLGRLKSGVVVDG
jgi:hypothetical protein